MIKPGDWARLAVGESDWVTFGPEWEIDYNTLRKHVTDAVRAAVNEALEEAAARIEGLERRGVHGIAAEMVRAMKVN